MPVPRRKRVEASVIVIEAIYNPPFEATIEVSGVAKFVVDPDAPIIYENDVGLPFFIYPDPNVAVSRVENHLKILAKVSGIYSGVTGIAYHIETKQYDIANGVLEATVSRPVMLPKIGDGMRRAIPVK